MFDLKLAQFILPYPELEQIKLSKVRRWIRGFLCKKTSSGEVCPKCTSGSASIFDHRRVRVKDELCSDLSKVQKHFHCSADTVYRYAFQQLE